MRRIAALIAAACALAAHEAVAHITLEQTQATTDSYYKATLRVPHGCNGSPTVRIRVRIPEGVTGVKPQPKQAWKLETTRVKLSPPLDDGHGGKITETVGEVAWSGGALADEHFDEFMMMMKLPDRPGATLYFPVVQECAKGVHRWIETGKPAQELKEPAPALRLTPKQ
jgi:uncharacterized protein YcnI